MKKGLVAIVAGLVVLTGCVNTPPSATEVANEIIDSLDESDQVKDCMRLKVAGFGNLDDAAAKADDGDPEAQKVIDAFEAALAQCKNG
ncbi:MAG: hypothetical protein CSA55_00825 [Ilumatobacter coccineus]|uniref:Lipoprotein n=1 Tax=Ilumatobacter coccineus TaxID=467094 RepID=A0A2G6KFJ5_9ACTN|nr:MAG: hypothetical protein CSA55_00825 [Ilumatobacter coccineus]